MFILLRNCQIVFHSSCATVHNFSTSSITLAIFLFFFFLLFVMAILVGRMLALHSFDFHLLMTNATEYFFILALSTFSLDKCLCESFVRFLIELFVLWLHMCKKDNLILKTCQERYIKIKLYNKLLLEKLIKSKLVSPFLFYLSFSVSLVSLKC